MEMRLKNMGGGFGAAVDGILQAGIGGPASLCVGAESILH
jgi:hypothetical protein